MHRPKLLYIYNSQDERLFCHILVIRVIKRYINASLIRVINSYLSASFCNGVWREESVGGGGWYITCAHDTSYFSAYGGGERGGGKSSHTIQLRLKPFQSNILLMLADTHRRPKYVFKQPMYQLIPLLRMKMASFVNISMSPHYPREDHDTIIRVTPWPLRGLWYNNRCKQLLTHERTRYLFLFT